MDLYRVERTKDARRMYDLGEYPDNDTGWVSWATKKPRGYDKSTHSLVHLTVPDEHVVGTVFRGDTDDDPWMYMRPSDIQPEHFNRDTYPVKPKTPTYTVGSRVVAAHDEAVWRLGFEAGRAYARFEQANR